MHLSFAFLPALAAVILAQGTALPDLDTTAGTSTVGPLSTPAACTGCFIVAGVAQVIFANYTQTATASAIVTATTGRNRTVVATTIFEPAQSFSFDTSGLLAGTPVTGAYVPVSGTELIFSGVTLVSPTAYNVFTAYTSYNLVTNSAGSCVSSIGGMVPLSSAYSFPIENGASLSSEVQAAELQFITAIGGLATCAAGGAVVSSTVAMPTTSVTVTTSASVLARPSSLPDSAAPTTTTSAASAAATTTVASGGSIGTVTSIVMVSPTIVMGAGSNFHPQAISTSLIAALLIIPGIAAWLL